MASFQPVSEDGPSSDVECHVHATDKAGDGDEDVAVLDLVQWLESLDDAASYVHPVAHLPVSTDVHNLPFRVSTTGPPVLSTEVQKGIVRHSYHYISNQWTTLWQMEPDIDIIRNMIKPFALLCGLPNDDITVTFFAEGMFNKVYTVQAADRTTGATKECIFRCAMPDFPWYRIQAEVSTIELVRHYSTIPVPKIYAFDSSMDNPLKLEWMLMEKIQGQTLQDAEESEAISFESKVKIHEAIADWIDQLSCITFDSMGSIYHDWNKPLSDISSYKVGPLVLDEFNYDLRLDLPVTRGPFTSRCQYQRARVDFCLAEALDPRLKERAEYYAPRAEADAAWQERLDITRNHCKQKVQRDIDEVDEREAKLKYMNGALRPKPPIPSNDGGRYEALERQLGPRDRELEKHTNIRYGFYALAAIPAYCLRLQTVLPALFDDTPFAPRSCALHHPDMHEENVLVDGDGKAVALIDWEKCFATPVRYMDRYPKMIYAPGDEDDEDEDEDDPREPEPWTSDEPKDEERLEAEREWEKYLEDVRLREVFDRRLEQLASPFLAPRDKVKEDSAERQLECRLFSMPEWCASRDERLEGWEKMARERFMNS